MLDSINFTDLSVAQVEEVLYWRNHPSIRMHMRNEKEITMAEHLKFLEKLKDDFSRYYSYMHEHNSGVGIFSLTDIKENSAEVGVYVNPVLHGKGYGSKILDCLIDHAAIAMNLTTLFLEVYKDNYAAICLYKKHGFKVYNESDNMIKMKLALFTEVNGN